MDIEAFRKYAVGAGDNTYFFMDKESYIHEFIKKESRVVHLDYGPWHPLYNIIKEEAVRWGKIINSEDEKWGSK